MHNQPSAGVTPSNVSTIGGSPPDPSSSPTPLNSASTSKPPVGAIVGGVVGGVAVIAGCLLFYLFYWRRQRGQYEDTRQKAVDPTVPGTSEPLNAIRHHTYQELYQINF